MWFVVKIRTFFEGDTDASRSRHCEWKLTCHIMCVHLHAAVLLWAQTAALCAEPVRPSRGRFWRRSIISNGSGSHNGGTLSDLLGMHCGRQKRSLWSGCVCSPECAMSENWSCFWHCPPITISGSLSLLKKKKRMLPIFFVRHTCCCMGQNYLWCRFYLCFCICLAFVSKINGQLTVGVWVCMWACKCASACLSWEARTAQCL